MTEDNPLDLTEVAKKYNWTGTKDIEISFIVKSCRGEADAQNQLFCWMRDHFREEAMLMIKQVLGQPMMLTEDGTELDTMQKKFTELWYKVIEYRIVGM